MIKKNKIIFDADGVLLDTLPYFIKWFLKNVPNFDIKVLFKEKKEYILKKFGNDYESFSNIPAMKDAKEILEYLNNKYNIDVITSYGGTYINNKGREDNIKKHFGKYIDEIIVLPIGYSKKDLYADYEWGTIVIDDSIKNCKDAKKLGLKVLWYKYYSLLTSLINQKAEIERDKNIIEIVRLKEIEKYL